MDFRTDREKQLMKEAEAVVQRHSQVVKADPNRLTYHLMPPVGLLNDPNGLIYYKGVYHVFFQWNPFATEHGAKFWGHYTTTDLVTWKLEPIALAPSEWFEKNGCYSGSAIEKDGEMFLFYTGNVKDENNNRETFQCVAVSNDGFSFQKKGPVVTLPECYTAHFRDPKVWEKNGKWYMVVGAQSLHGEGEVALFSSLDLENWKFHGSIAGSKMNGLDEFGYMWECPDLFSLDGADVLIVSPQGLNADGFLYNNLYQSGYFIGKLDEIEATYEHGSFTELDRGFDFYAPQTMLDDEGRRILIGWMGVPEENEEDHPTIQHQWIHCMTLPRKLELKEGKLYQTPVEELKKLRKEQSLNEKIEVCSDKVQLPSVKGAAIELVIQDIQGEFESFEISFGDACRFVYDANERLATLERKRFKEDSFESRTCKLDSLESLQIYKDTSSIELFLNEGQEVFSARVFGTVDDQSIAFAADGGGRFKLSIWCLSSSTIKR
nr:sucrose-6-phosphate hydrolase [Sutcliffiella halmapala]